MNWPVYKRELLSYFRTPIAYVFIAAFNLAVMISSFFLNGLLDTDQADLQPFFGALPWLLLVLVPGIGMRSWAEEKSSKTLELTLTLPLDARSVLLAKFFAAWTVVAFALALSFPLPLTVAYLGQPDWGAIVSGYLGGFLMAGSLLAVANLSSVLSRIQVVSFVLAVFASLGLLVVGWGVFSDFLREFLPLVLVDAIAYLGVITHYEALGRGVVPLQDVIYFILIGSLALLLCDLFLSSYGRNANLGTQLVKSGSRHLPVALLLLGLLLANAFVNFRVDLSANQAYSISKDSLALAQAIDRPTEIKLFFSDSLPQASPFMKQYSYRVKSVLEQYAQAAPGQITVQKIDPKPDSGAEDEALAAGLQGLAGPQGSLYFGIAMQSGADKAAIPFLDPNREDLLEYEIAKALMALNVRKKQHLAIFTSMKMRQTQADGSIQAWSLLEALSGTFEVDTWNTLPAELPADLDVLFIFHPKEIDKDARRSIDSFLMRGGRIMLALDPFSRIELIQKHGRPQLDPGGEMPSFSSQFDQLFSHWGIKFDATKVIGDASRAANINILGQSIPHPLFMKLGSQDFSKAPFLKNLREVFIAEGGSLSLESGKNVKMEALLQTGSSSGALDNFVLAFQSPQAIVASFRVTLEKQVVAAVYQGSFESLFEAGKSAKSEIIVIGDVDFMDDRHATRSQSIGGKTLNTPRNDNLNFVINALEYLAGSASLAGVRTSGVIARPFTLLRTIQAEAEERWRGEEKKVQESIKAAQQQLSTFYARDQASNTLPLRSDDLKMIKDLRQKQRLMDQRFRSVRLNLREDSERLFHGLIAANIVTPIALVLLGALGFSLWRFRKLPQLKLSVLYVPLTAIVLAGVLFAGQKSSLKAAPVFDTLFDMEDLAGIERVIVSENGKQATLVKGPEGIWRMQEAGMQAINADRLSRLLYDMAEAKIVRRLTTAQGPTDSYGFDQGRSLAFTGQFNFKLTVGKQQEHGGYLVKLDGQERPLLIDDFLHTYVDPEFWLQKPEERSR